MRDHLDPIDRLRSLGTADVPALDPDRLAAIEARVMSAVSGAPEAVSGERRGRAAVWLAAAAVVLAFAVIALAARPDGDARLVVAAADRVTVELVDGTRAAATAGDELDEGTIVEVASGGTIQIDGRRYGPGQYVVDGASLRAITPTEPDSATVPTRAGTTSDPAPEPTREPTPTTSPAVPTVTRPIVAPAPSSTRPATTVAVTRPPSTRPATTAPSTTRAPTTTGAPAAGAGNAPGRTSTPPATTTTLPARGARP